MLPHVQAHEGLRKLKRLFGDFPLIEAYEKVTQIIFHFDMM